MNIFAEFEGLSGENLSSAILHYLLLNSEEVREVFMDYLSDNSPQGLISTYEHFSVRKEFPTQDDKYGNGRLDLLIQVDNFVIGIENKFHAAFQEGQPEKYQQSLSNTAELMQKINQTDVSPLLFILCPKYKVKEAKTKAKLHPNNTAVVSWEGVLERLKQIPEVLNPIAGVVLIEFRKYLNEQFSFMPLYRKKYAHFRNEFPERGTSLQHELASVIWYLLPEPYSHLSRGKQWVGYYFHNDPEDPRKGWFGFIPDSSFVNGSKNKAELVIATNYELSGSHESLVLVDLKDKYFLGSDEPYFAYRVDFKDNWDTYNVWREKLAPYSSST